LAKADFNRDGKEETVNVQTKEDYQIIEIVDENGNCLWKDTAGIPHSDWNSFFLCTIEGSAYILQYRPYMIQGSGYYSYKLLYLSEDNKETVYRSNKIEFDINFDQGGHSFDIPAIVAFMNEINGYLAHSELLISTDENLKFDSNTCLQDNLSWLHENTKFQYNESASLSENLRAYEEFEIGQQHE